MINQAFVNYKSDKLIVYKNMSDYKSFGEWLRNKIKENGISNAELARRVDVSATYIGNLVRDFSPNSKTGNIRASESVVEAIAKALSADLDEARLAAGYAPKESLPDFLYEIDFSILNEAQLKEIENFIRFKLAEPKPVYPDYLTGEQKVYDREEMLKFAEIQFSQITRAEFIEKFGEIKNSNWTFKDDKKAA